MWACAYDQCHMVSYLLDNGADVNAAGLKGETSLMQACSAGNHQVASLLLDRGCHVNAVDCVSRSELIMLHLHMLCACVRRVLHLEYILHCYCCCVVYFNKPGLTTVPV